MIQDTEMPPDRCRRIVFEHRLGPWRGLRQILGTTDDLRGEPIPATSDPFTAVPDGREAVAGLITAKQSYLVYREIDASLPVRLR